MNKRPLDTTPENDAGAVPAELPDDMGEDIRQDIRQRAVVVPSIRKGSILQARDGTKYIVERVNTRPELGPVPSFAPRKPRKVLIRHTFTLRRAQPKTRGKAARKAQKRARHATLTPAALLTEAHDQAEGGE